MVEIMCQETTDYLEYTRSCAALRAADLGLSGQDAFRGRTFGRFPASLFSPLALSSNWTLILIQLLQCSFFVSYAGSQLTLMTQNEKVHIFRYLRGVATDLHDTE